VMCTLRAQRGRDVLDHSRVPPAPLLVAHAGVGLATASLLTNPVGGVLCQFPVLALMSLKRPTLLRRRSPTGRHNGGSEQGGKGG